MWKSKSKGITKPVVKNCISFKDYKICLEYFNYVKTGCRVSRSQTHCIKTLTINKLALCVYDDKRTVCDHGVHTIAFGH